MSHASCYHIGYGLSCPEYDDLLALADGRCMHCGLEAEPLQLDHDHALGQWAVRGLVCGLCNQHLRYVDTGARDATGRTAAYLANAWHLRQPNSADKQARMKPRVTCGRCGMEVATYANGKPYRHWSRLSGEGDTICPAA